MEAIEIAGKRRRKNYTDRKAEGTFGLENDLNGDELFHRRSDNLRSGMQQYELAFAHRYVSLAITPHRG
jgi:hypothetical protein